MCRLVSSAGNVTVGLILRPLSDDVSTTPALIALLYTCESVGIAIAGVFAIRDGQGCVSIRARISVEKWERRILYIAPYVGPRSRRRGGCRRGGRGRSRRDDGGQSRYWLGIDPLLRKNAI